MNQKIKDYLNSLPTAEKERWKKDLRNYTLKNERLHLKYLTEFIECEVCGTHVPKDSALTTDLFNGVYVCSDECGVSVINDYTQRIELLKIEGFSPLHFELYKKQKGLKNPMDDLLDLAYEGTLIIE